LFNKYVGILATIFITTLYNISDYKEGFIDEDGIEIENPEPSSNALYGTESFSSSSPAEIAQDDDDDDEDENGDDTGELTTQGQGPPNLSNILV
jgi:hypothetical protein